VKVLHVTGDWKWTGSAGPMLELLLAQRARGESSELVCPAAETGASTSLTQRAGEQGVKPLLELARGRGVSLWRDRNDVRRLTSLVAEHEFDVVHTWHTRDHVLALRALAKRRRDRRTRLVRSFASAEPIAAWPWNRWLFGPGTDGLLCVSPDSAARNAQSRGGRATAGSFGAVDLSRFAPVPRRDETRRSLGLAAGDRVVAIVARVQRHRRFDLLIDAMQRLAAVEPRARLLVIGRGTHIDEVARQPVEARGLADRVCFAGYLGGGYAEALRAADVITYLVPGSDGTCRALLEAMACGLPAVVTRRGALPEIVLDSDTGLVVDETPEALAAAWGTLLADDELRVRMGTAARARAERHFSPAAFAQRVAELYRC
jgi:glycosyltransferase involved in cell wall biosynthesis